MLLRLLNFERLPGVSKCTVPVCLALFLATAAPSASGKARTDEARIAQCIHDAAAGTPWLEKTLWGLRDQEAGWIGAEIPNPNGTHDLGPLQVNSAWVPRIAALVGRSEADVRAWLIWDPCFNAGTARWLFLTALNGTRDFWKAVGIYHSPTAWRQQRYSASVARHLQGRFGGDAFAAPLAPQPGSVTAPPTEEAPQRLAKPVVRMQGFGRLSE